MDDGIGKEITTQIRTTMKTNKTFYTDSNGRDFIKRVCQFLLSALIYFLQVKFSCITDDWNDVNSNNKTSCLSCLFILFFPGEGAEYLGQGIITRIRELKILMVIKTENFNGDIWKRNLQGKLD